MIMSDTTRSKLLELVSDLRSEKTRLEKQFQAEIAKVDIDLQSVQRTLDLLIGDRITITQPAQQFELDMINAPLITQAKNQIEALKVIARQNPSNVVNTTKSADILIQAKKAHGKRRNLVASIHGYLSNSDEWEKVSPGNFKLKIILPK